MAYIVCSESRIILRLGFVKTKPETPSRLFSYCLLLIIWLLFIHFILAFLDSFLDP